MDLKSLHYFVTIIEAGSFTQASRRLGIAQPALGWQIRKLEDELSTKLLTRHSRGIEATDAGLLLLDHAREILARTNLAIAQIRNISSEPQGAVTLGVTPSVNALLTVPLLRRLSEVASDIRLDPVEEISMVLTEWVLDGRLDMALCLQVSDHPDLHWEPLVGEPMYFVESAKHSTRKGGVITFEEAARYELVMGAISPWFQTLLRKPRAKGIFRSISATRIKSVATLRDLVEQGIAATIQPFGMVLREVATGVLHASRIIEPEMTRHVCLVHNSTSPMSKASCAVRDLVKKLIKENRSDLDRNMATLAKNPPDDAVPRSRGQRSGPQPRGSRACRHQSA